MVPRRTSQESLLPSLADPARAYGRKAWGHSVQLRESAASRPDAVLCQSPDSLGFACGETVSTSSFQTPVKERRVVWRESARNFRRLRYPQLGF